jgi:foldase protein PrsA
VVSQELNKISDPVETEFGYHFIRVESRSTLSLDFVKAELEQTLLTDRSKQFYEKDLAGLIQNIALPKP